MEIGGYDIVIETLLSPSEAEETILHIIRDYWPDLVTERPDDGLYEHEMFIYKDQAAKDSWDDDGGTDDNLTTMIMTIIDENHHQVTVVHDNNWKIIEELRKGLVAE